MSNGNKNTRKTKPRIPADQPTPVEAPRREPSLSAVEQKIAYCQIYPGVGIARLGNSPEEYFIGPEAPGHPPKPLNGFKDEAGRVKRQAARFRIYAFNEQGEAIKELTDKDARITWTVHLANKKAHHWMFLGSYWDIQYPMFKAVNPEHPPLRNQELKGEEDRKALIIDPGSRSISGSNQKGVKFDGGTMGPLPYSVVTEENKKCLKYSRSGYMGGPFPVNQSDPASGAPIVLPLATGCPTEGGRKDGLILPIAVSEKVEVPLGELRTDAQGRLLVLGGQGNSASLIPDNDIYFLNSDSAYANNDYWYDDTSDGPVTAEVELLDGTKVKVKDKAWVLVAPPKYAPDLEILTTLYDVAMETWDQKSPSKNGNKKSPLSFTNDIYPILSRMVGYQWINANAFRGHGPGMPGDFLSPTLFPLLKNPANEPGPREARQNVFQRLRTPGLAIESDAAKKQSNATRMPLMAGDGGEPITEGTQNNPVPGGTYITWLTLSPTQYANMERWAKGDFIDDWPANGRPPQTPSLSRIDVRDQPAALDRAALEFCVGLATYPGIEITYTSRDPNMWSAPCRLRQDLEPGDVTKYMALPWQADFSECRKHWWPAQRPDDVVPEAEFTDALKTYDPKLDGPLGKVLAYREDWARGIAKESPGLDNDMVTAWKDFGFIVAMDGPGDQRVYVETERSPYAGTDLRDYFYYLMNIDSYPDFIPKAHALVEEFLAQAEQNQKTADSANDEHWSFFEYTPESFNARLDQVYNDFVSDAANPELYELNLGQTREQVIYTILQFAPFNQLDGAWLRHATPGGPIDDVHSMIFSIYMDELGDGNTNWNHCNVYTDLLKSVNIYLPDLNTREYADNTQFLDSAFVEPVFLLAISQFSEDFFPELLGMTLYLEWEAVSLVPIVDQFKAFGIDPLYYVLHVGIDNAASGHGAIAKAAVEMYLDQVRAAQGEEAMRETWKRIWNGYVAFGTLGTLGQDIQDMTTNPPTLEDQMVAMIQLKAEYGSRNHRDKMLGMTFINDWFLDPEGFLGELQKSGIVIPGDPDNSPITQLMSFNGPMFHVFTLDEQALWRDWILSLKPSKPEKEDNVVTAMHHLINVLRRRQEANEGHNVTLWGPDPKHPGKQISLSIHEWFDLDLGSPEENNRALMRAIAEPKNGWVVPSNAAASPLVTTMLSGNNDMAQAFQEMETHTGGKTYKNILVEWIDLGCPTVEVEVTKKAKRPVAVTKAAITTEMTVEEVHAKSEAMARQHVRVKPRKIWGMGKVH
jgi:L-lysine epsilon oxidase-like protein/heme oxygenase-like protein